LCNLLAPRKPHLGPAPGRLIAASPHFPAMLRRLVEIAVRLREPHLHYHSAGGGLCPLSDAATSALSRLIETQPRARWLLLAPALQLQWSNQRSEWEEATVERTVQALLRHVYASEAVREKSRKVASRTAPRAIGLCVCAHDV
jgi:hypothetical protein